jgi:hypothetical protein
MDNENVRTFVSGATRSAATHKLDYEGFFNPLVLHTYAKYLHKHRKQENGAMRGSDNWQNGMPREEYMKSLLRHVHDLWCIHRGYFVYREKIEGEGEATHVHIRHMEETEGKCIPVSRVDSICGIIFNAFGYLLELVLNRDLTKE